MIKAHVEDSWHDDRATQSLVPNLANGTLPTDPKHLEAMFMFCTNNWRSYSGEKPQGDKLVRINAVYKQATLGDCKDTKWETPFQQSVVKMWCAYKGTPQLMAKRRFLALLRDVDPRLLHIKAHHSVPWGFPTSAKGECICPYSNTKKGCPRPLIDKHGNRLENELENNERLSDLARLREWLDEAASQQRCSLGLHVPVSEDMGAKFAKFFARPECGSFQPYTPKMFHEIVKKELMKKMIALDEPHGNGSRELCRIAQASQQDRVSGLYQIYKRLTGQELPTEIPCTNDSHQCNTRRLEEGSNHTHPAVKPIPPTDLSLYNELTQVRRECERLGVTPVTGTTQSIDHRYRLLQMKVVDFHRKKLLVYESQRRRQWRSDVAPRNAEALKAFAREHLSECLRNALAAYDMNRIILAVESGADPCIELRGGRFPLMTAVFTRSTSNIQRLLAVGVNIDTVNSKGMTALMWAVKRDDYAMVDMLVREGADVGLEGSTGWTAMSVAARHGRMDIAQHLIDHTLQRDKGVGRMNADRVLNHRSSINAGLTPLTIAAIHRNELMVRFLVKLGAKREIKCHQGYTAAEHATKAGWTALGNWLRETQAFGDKGVYTSTDMSTENALRVGNTCMLDAIVSGATVEDNKQGIQNKHSSHELLPGPSESQQSSPAEHRHVMSDMYDNMILDDVRSNTLLTVKVLRDGYAAPDTETDRGHTGIISAAYRGLGKCVRELILEGADPNYANRNDRTALMAAAAAGRRNTVVVLLAHGANASWMDIDGKTAGGYAFERGFHELAELLATAASRGNEEALGWEVERRRSAEEDKKCTVANIDLEMGGIEGGNHEVELNQWAIKPSKSTRVTETRQTSSLTSASQNPGKCTTRQDSDGGTVHSLQAQRARREVRCPKCTLFVPCRHYASLETMLSQFPDGAPEWDWNKRGVDYKEKLRKCSNSRLTNVSCNGKDGLFCEVGNVTWWRSLYKAHRERELLSRRSLGTGSARIRFEADKK